MTTITTYDPQEVLACALKIKRRFHGLVQKESKFRYVDDLLEVNKIIRDCEGILSIKELTNQQCAG